MRVISLKPIQRIAFHSENGPQIGGSDLLMGVVADSLDRDRWDVYALTRADYPFEKVFRRNPLPKAIGDAVCANSGPRPAVQLGGTASRSVRSCRLAVKAQILKLLPSGWRRRMGYRRVANRVRDLLASHQIDLFETRDGGLQPTVIGAKLAGCRTINRYSAPPPEGEVDALTRKLSRRVVAYSDVLLTMSRANAAAWEKFLALPAGSIRIIYNGVGELKHPADDRARAREEWGFPPDWAVVGMVGRMEPNKGVSDFTRALVRVAAQHPATGFVFCGEGTELDAARSVVRAAGLDSRVRFLGFRADSKHLAAGFDVAVTPSVFPEPFGLVATEALAAGVPLVASSVGGLPEIVEDGSNGFLVPPSAPEALAHRIGELVGNPDLRKRMGREGLESIRRKFSVRAMLTSFESLYLEVLSAGKGR